MYKAVYTLVATKMTAHPAKDVQGHGQVFSGAQNGDRYKSKQSPSNYSNKGHGQGSVQCPQEVLFPGQGNMGARVGWATVFQEADFLCAWC